MPDLQGTSAGWGLGLVFPHPARSPVFYLPANTPGNEAKGTNGDAINQRGCSQRVGIVIAAAIKYGLYKHLTSNGPGDVSTA